MKTSFLSHEGLAGLVSGLRSKGTLVIAPALARDGHVDYRFIERAEEAVLSGAVPRRSLKEFFLPPTEPLFCWREQRKQVDLSEVPVQFSPRVVLGARPCDAAGIETLDRVMGWDYQDELWFGRRAATTVITLACAGGDGSCFCKAVGLSPGTSKGADLLLVPVAGGHAVETVTEKGETLVRGHGECFSDMTDPSVTQTVSEGVPQGLEVSMPGIRAWLGKSFTDSLWDTLALGCHGCGACASVCPTCHCFDIVDEPEGIGHGTRRRNWDTCQTAGFTVHASGHNPRENQNARLRQRILHKFFIYPERFGEVLCTGCGRCARSCPAGIDLPEILARIARRAAGDGIAPGGAA